MSEHKDLTGVYGDNDFILNRGDSRISLTMPRDSYTIQLNRDSRFLVDDYGSPNVLAYVVTKPFKLGGTYNGKGVLGFVLQECPIEETDNLELHIPNYYKYFPQDDRRDDAGDDPQQEQKERKGLI